MAQKITACIYGQNYNDWGNPNGVYYGFPTQQTVFIPLIYGETMSGHIMKSKIKIIDGVTPYLLLDEFFTDNDVTALVIASNL